MSESRCVFTPLSGRELKVSVISENRSFKSKGIADGHRSEDAVCVSGFRATQFHVVIKLRYSHGNGCEWS